MLRRYSLLALLALTFFFAPRPASAAPFCVEITGMAPQCVYFDPAQCRLRAKQLSALCEPNPDEVNIVPGSSRYCLVTGSRASLCIYPDIQSCDIVAAKDRDAVCIDSGSTIAPLTGGATAAAQKQNGGIPENGMPVPEQQQDPFRTEPDRRY